jgi:2-polyprenyl-3-methyl-5-hydroxy-6-metoxy-1,4-benzoquinol methylase
VPASRPLDRVALDWALESIEALDRPRVLEVGCGDGALAAELAKHGARVTGADPSAVALERARREHPELALVQTGPDGRLPLDDSSFHAAVCLHVLEHVADTQLLLSEVRRVLAPEGMFALAVPYHGRLKSAAIALGGFERHYDPLEPVLRFYTRRSLSGLLARLGFGAIEVRARGGAPLFRESLLARARRR